MVDCGPGCTVPNIAVSPLLGSISVGALRNGSLEGLPFGGLGSEGLGFGLGGLGARGLGTLPGVTPSCISQCPSSEVVIQPRSCVVTIPGPILSASCEPVAVGGNTPCAVGNRFGGYGNLGCASNGLWGTGAWGRGGLLGNYGGCGKGFLGRRGSVCF